MAGQDWLKNKINHKKMAMPTLLKKSIKSKKLIKLMGFFKH